MDPELVPYYMHFGFAGASVGQFEHYFQIFYSNGQFPKYDYGPVKNLYLYGADVPPEYNLDQVTVKTSLLTGKADVISSPADSDKLAAVLPNLYLNEIINATDFGHVDFLFRSNMKPLVWDRIVTLLNS